MGQRWERFWLGKPDNRAHLIKSRTRLGVIGFWAILLFLDVAVIVLGEHHFLSGTILSIVAIGGIAGQVIPLTLHRRLGRSSRH